MWEEILKAIPVFFSAMLKFILGPSLGYAAGLHIITTTVVTFLSMMTVVLLFTYSGEWLKEKILSRFIKKHEQRTPNKRLARIWKRYGLAGIAFLTPLILTPIGGTLLAVSSGSPKEKIIFYMLISAAGWSVIFTSAIYLLGRQVLQVLPDFIR